jgi:hypothetical protein
MISCVTGVTDVGCDCLRRLAQLGCDTARWESRGAVCAFAASRDWCPIWDSLAQKGRKLHNYMTRKKTRVEYPDQYLQGVYERARRDPAELLGRTRSDGEEMLAYLRELKAVYPSDRTFKLPIWTSW